MQVGNKNESVFVVTDKYLDKCIRNGWDTNCVKCNMPFEVGHVCHSKFNGIKYKKRHIACAVTVGLVTFTDYEFAVIGYREKNQIDIKVVKTIKRQSKSKVMVGVR